MRTHHSLEPAIWIALGIAGVALGLVACGGGNGNTGTGGTGGGMHTTSSTGSHPATTSSSATSSSSSSGAMNCTEITFADFTKGTADGGQGVYNSTPSPSLGDAAIADNVQLGFFGPDFGSFDGDMTGSFDLTMDGDNNFQTCSRCILVSEDVDPTNGAARSYFQQSGTLVVDAASDQLHGKLHATLMDITLVEVTIDDMTSQSTPVAGGKCLHLASAAIMIDPPVVPTGWTCDPSYYADGSCDCGCGVLDDMDCADAMATTCDYNQCTSGKPNATQNWMCDPVPAGWLCDPVNYGDGMCDCGCSLQDSDCASAAASDCMNDQCGSPSMAIDGMNWLCSGVPTGWTCTQSFYGDGSCDCGCGVVDMDCADAMAATCDYCDDTGACGLDDCSNIDPTNNAVCTP